MRKSLLNRTLKATALSLGMLALGYGVQQTYKFGKQIVERKGFVKEGTYQGYKTIAGKDGASRKITILDGDNYLSALDWENNGIGRFDEIHLRSLPQGHPLEKLANLDELERAYASVTAEKQ